MGNRRLIFFCLSLVAFLGEEAPSQTIFLSFSASPLSLSRPSPLSAPLESFGVTISLLPRGHPPLDKHLMDTNQADGSMAIHSVIRCIAASLGKARRSSQEDFFCGAGQRKTSLSRAVRFKAESARPTGVRRSSWTADGNWDPPSMQLVAVQKIGPGSLDWSNGSRPERANAGSVTVWLTESRDAMERSGCGRGRATWATKRFSTRWDRWNSSVK
ncbi:hypothetical protein M440DRAFT_127932 [Trichoderma longibrachiatum ATCC 18648]|uniref:Uncharacterized protein n=1 Tax=Trichoderma longibrachiatum ATCC 18648 TaxID=983965 RepID=A0A2T4BXP9_TRILO|nr:hypothetical protein M440DRAFT_127932 [Trichoderma longibrachiatum ATCC 18648]